MVTVVTGGGENVEEVVRQLERAGKKVYVLGKLIKRGGDEKTCLEKYGAGLILKPRPPPRTPCMGTAFPRRFSSEISAWRRSVE